MRSRPLLIAKNGEALIQQPTQSVAFSTGTTFSYPVIMHCNADCVVEFVFWDDIEAGTASTRTLKAGIVYPFMVGKINSVSVADAISIQR